MLSSNPYFTWYDLLYMTIQNLDIQGNVYWLKIRDHMKVLREIRLIFPKHITIISDPDNYIKSYRYKDNSASFDIDPSDIIHFKRQKAGGMYYRQSMALSPMKLKKSSFTQFEAGP